MTCNQVDATLNLVVGATKSQIPPSECDKVSVPLETEDISWKAPPAVARQHGVINMKANPTEPVDGAGKDINSALLAC